MNGLLIHVFKLIMEDGKRSVNMGRLLAGSVGIALLANDDVDGNCAAQGHDDDPMLETPRMKKLTADKIISVTLSSIVYAKAYSS